MGGEGTGVVLLATASLRQECGVAAASSITLTNTTPRQRIHHLHLRSLTHHPRLASSHPARSCLSYNSPPLPLPPPTPLLAPCLPVLIPFSPCPVILVLCSFLPVYLCSSFFLSCYFRPRSSILIKLHAQSPYSLTTLRFSSFLQSPMASSRTPFLIILVLFSLSVHTHPPAPIIVLRLVLLYALVNK